MNRRVVGLVAAAGISHLGTGMTMLAVPWFVLDSSGRGTEVGLAVMAEAAGVLAGSVFGGPWIDWLRPRRAAVVFDVLAAVVVLAIPLLHRGQLLPLWVLTVLAAMLGVSRAPGDAARQVLVPEIADRDGLPVERVTTAYAAPAQGARAMGAPNALVLDAGSFVLSAVVTWIALDEIRSMPERGRSYAGQLVDGLRFLRGDRTLAAIMVRPP